MSLTVSYLESVYSITPVEPLKANRYDYFVFCIYFVYFIFIQLTHSKLRNSDSGYSICYSQVLLKWFTFFMINRADKEIYK